MEALYQLRYKPRYVRVVKAVADLLSSIRYNGRPDKSYVLYP